MLPTPSTSDDPPVVTDIQYNKTMFKGRLFNLLGDVTKENKLTLLEINQVLQEVSVEVANDLNEVLSPHYASRQ